MTIREYCDRAEIFEFTKENFEIEKLISENHLIELTLGSANYVESVAAYTESMGLSLSEPIELIFEASDPQKAKGMLREKLEKNTDKLKHFAHGIYVKAMSIIERAIQAFINFIDSKYKPGANTVLKHLDKFDSINDIWGDSLEALENINPGTSKQFESSFVPSDGSDEFITEASKKSYQPLIKAILKKAGWNDKYVNEYSTALIGSAEGFDFPVRLNLEKHQVGSIIGTFAKVSSYSKMKELLKTSKDVIKGAGKGLKSGEASDLQKSAANFVKAINEKIAFYTKFNKAMMTLKPTKNKEDADNTKKEKPAKKKDKNAE